MSALLTALIESETKETLAAMVVELRQANAKLISHLAERCIGISWHGNRPEGLECQICFSAGDFDNPPQHVCTCPIVACATENLGGAALPDIEGAAV